MNLGALLRFVYFGAVVVGLVFTLLEYRAVRKTYREIRKKGINGNRQLVAQHFMREERIFVIIQALLLLPSGLGATVPIMGPFAQRTHQEAWMVLGNLAQLATTAVAILLMAAAIGSRNYRKDLMDGVE